MNHDALANLRRPTVSPAHVGSGAMYASSDYLIPSVTGFIGALCYLKGHKKTALGFGAVTLLSGAWAYSES